MINIDNILKSFPQELKEKINKIFTKENIDINLLEEIRIRVNRPVILKISNEEILIEYIIKSEEILNILSAICENSIYTYEEQICNRIYNNKWTDIE